jgi:hypothetical protein
VLRRDDSDAAAAAAVVEAESGNDAVGGVAGEAEAEAEVV